YPPFLSAWCKVQLGYVAPLVVTDPLFITIAPAETNAQAVKINVGYGSQEYLLIENREPMSFDTLMVRGGLAIWHVDESIPHQAGDPCNKIQGFPGQAGWPENGNHYAIALLQADGRYDLEKNVNADTTDLYHDLAGIALSETTVPSSDRYRLN